MYPLAHRSRAATGGHAIMYMQRIVGLDVCIIFLSINTEHLQLPPESTSAISGSWEAMTWLLVTEQGTD